MSAIAKTRAAVLSHCAAYPRLAARDLFKFLYQSTFGCGHMVRTREEAVARIRAEAEELTQGEDTAAVPLDGPFCRLPLSYLAKGLSAETLGALFELSARDTDGDIALLEERLDVCRRLAAEGLLPFSCDALLSEWEAWRQAGYPAVSHTEAFRALYRPAYRVIASRYARLLPLLIQLDKRLAGGPVILAIEGGSASGKTTLAALLGDVYGATILHMDDFFLRPEQRTDARRAEVGGNLDRERFTEEVALPLIRGGAFSYRRFDCGKQTLCEPTAVTPARLTVVEGAYSTHPEIPVYYGLSAFLTISPELQRARIEVRNTPETARRHIEEWIPKEEAYFSAFGIQDRCDIILDAE